LDVILPEDKHYKIGYFWNKWRADEIEMDNVLMYYLRKDHSDNERIILIGVWNDKNQRVFCRLKKAND